MQCEPCGQCRRAKVAELLKKVGRCYCVLHAAYSHIVVCRVCCGIFLVNPHLCAKQRFAVNEF